MFSNNNANLWKLLKLLQTGTRQQKYFINVLFALTRWLILESCDCLFAYPSDFDLPGNKCAPDSVSVASSLLKKEELSLFYHLHDVSSLDFFSSHGNVWSIKTYSSCLHLRFPRATNGGVRVRNTDTSLFGSVCNCCHFHNSLCGCICNPL